MEKTFKIGEKVTFIKDEIEIWKNCQASGISNTLIKQALSFKFLTIRKFTLPGDIYLEELPCWWPKEVFASLLEESLLERELSSFLGKKKGEEKEEEEYFINNTPNMYKTYNGPRIGEFLKRTSYSD